MRTEEQWAQRNSGHRNSENRGTVGIVEQLGQRNSGDRGTVVDRGTVGTEEQWGQ